MTWQLFAVTILSFIFQRPTYWKKLELSDRPGTRDPFTFSTNSLWERPRSSNVSTLILFSKTETAVMVNASLILCNGTLMRLKLP